MPKLPEQRNIEESQTPSERISKFLNPELRRQRAAAKTLREGSREGSRELRKLTLAGIADAAKIEELIRFIEDYPDEKLSDQIAKNLNKWNSELSERRSDEHSAYRIKAHEERLRNMVEELYGLVKEKRNEFWDHP